MADVFVTMAVYAGPMLLMMLRRTDTVAATVSGLVADAVLTGGHMGDRLPADRLRSAFISKDALFSFTVPRPARPQLQQRWPTTRYELRRGAGRERE